MTPRADVLARNWYVPRHYLNPTGRVNEMQVDDFIRKCATGRFLHQKGQCAITFLRL
jgi:hypothetical protein